MVEVTRPLPDAFDALQIGNFSLIGYTKACTVVPLKWNLIPTSCGRPSEKLRSATSDFAAFSPATGPSATGPIAVVASVSQNESPLPAAHQLRTLIGSLSD